MIEATRAVSERRGIVLVVVILALALIGTLVVGAYAAALRHTRGGQLRYRQAEALAAAEYGAEQEFARLAATPSAPGTPLANAAAGQTIRSLTGLRLGGATIDVDITRLGDSVRELYLINAFARAGGGAGRGAARGVTIFAGVDNPSFGVLGGLTTAGAVSLSAGGTVSGADSAPPGWSCAGPSAADLPGIAFPSGASLTSGSCSGGSCINGTPSVLRTPLAADSMRYEQFGDLDWAALRANAKIVPPLVAPNPSATGGSCDAADPSNWGAPVRATPASPCETYFPVLYVPGDLQLTGGQGQGVLLVGGSLTVSGGANFFGVVVVRGGIRATGTGGTIRGAALVESRASASVTLAAPLTVAYSSCAVAAASAAQRIFGRIPSRSWVEAY